MICPFLKEICYEKTCALWSKQYEQCSITDIAECLNILSSVIDEDGNVMSKTEVEIYNGD